MHVMIRKILAILVTCAGETCVRHCARSIQGWQVKLTTLPKKLQHYIKDPIDTTDMNQL